MPIINFLNPFRDSIKVSKYSRKVLEDIMKKSGVSQITITSTARTSQEQARIMHENIEKHGVAHQKRLYGNSGDKIIDEYTLLKSQGKSSSDVISGMNAKIISIGPSKVSRHAGDHNKLNVIDIAPSSISYALRKKFESAVTSDSRVLKFLTPPGDPAYHIEIVQS